MGWTMHARLRGGDRLFCVFLVLAVGVVYAPSLRHSPRNDHWAFLKDTSSHHGLFDLVRGSYSYTRTRTTAPGDTDLFRPVLFALLAAEKAVFGETIWYTQLVGIVLHTCVCLLLLSLLRRIEAIFHPRRLSGANDPCSPSPTWLPRVIAAFFALNPAIVEMVIWSHIHGYLLFLVFLLGSANLLLRHVSSPRAGEVSSPPLVGAWALALFAAFTYELGQIYAISAGAFLAAAVYSRSGPGRALSLLGAFAAILVIYQAVNRYDLELHRGQFVPDNHQATILRKAFTSDTLTHSRRFALYTTVQPFCPSLLREEFVRDRVSFQESLYRQPVLKRCGMVWAISVAVLVSGSFLAVVGLWSTLWRRDRLPLHVLLFATSLYLAYAAMNVLGRMNLRPGINVLSFNSYYAYMPLLLALVTLFALWQGVSRNAGFLRGLAWKTTVAGLVILTLVGALKVRSINTRFAGAVKCFSIPIRAVDQFVSKYRHKPNFSLAIDYPASDPVPDRGGDKVTEIVFARWISANPRYRIAIRHKKAVIVAVNSPDR